MTSIDINENLILDEYPEILDILLSDHSSNKNIVWATKHYWRHGKGFRENEQIRKELITGRNSSIIKPRVNKSLSDKKKRSKDNAEVFTPSWVCNKQNNIIDDSWFGYQNAFNCEDGESWKTNDKVNFIDKDWHEYIDLERMEITCGEAPYLTSRYDAVSGTYIEPKDRIGLLDRKLLVVCQNAKDDNEWNLEVEKSFKRIYGYEFQGDNLLLARENLLYTFIDFYIWHKGCKPDINFITKIAKIVSWNIWQMDGLKYVIPLSCHKEEMIQLCLFPEMEEEPDICRGCKNDNIFEHNGIYCKIKDWRANKVIRFVDLLK